MYPPPKRQRPVPQGMSPNPGITPMDLAGNPMLAQQYQQQQQGAGMLDPRVQEAYDQMKSAGETRIEAVREHEPKEASVLRSALKAAPMAALGLFTGGAAIPAALAYATAAGAMDFEQDKDTRKAWEMKEADEIFNTRKAIHEAAEDTFGYDANINKDQRVNMRKEFEWIQGMPESPEKEAAWKAWQNKYSGQTDELLRLLRSNPSMTREIGGHEGGVAGNVKEAQEREARFAALRRTRDDIEINYVPMLDETATAAQEMLDKINSGEGTWSFPVLGAWLANVIPDLAEMQQYAAGEALSNLEITNLAPVTEKEITFIQTMAANPAAWNDEVNIRRLKGTLKKLARSKEKVARQLGYIRNELGEKTPESAQAAPVAEPTEQSYDLTYNPDTGKFE